MAESTTQYPPATIQYGVVRAATADFLNLTQVIIEEATIDFNEPIIDGSVGTIPSTGPNSPVFNENDNVIDVWPNWTDLPFDPRSPTKPVTMETSFLPPSYVIPIIQTATGGLQEKRPEPTSRATSTELDTGITNQEAFSAAPKSTISKWILLLWLLKRIL